MIHSVEPPVDGSAAPKVARLRRSHGARTARNAAALAMPAAQPAAAAELAARQPGGGGGHHEQRAVDAGKGRGAGEQPGEDDPAAAVRGAHGMDGGGERARAERAEDREVLDRGVVDEERAGEGGEHGRDDGDPAALEQPRGDRARWPGTSAAERRMLGSWPARYEGPSSAIGPAARIEVSGIQCALLGTGSSAGFGSREPTSRKLQITGTLKPWPVASRSATSV